MTDAPPACPHALAARPGFSILELSIALVVIGALLAVGVSAWSTMAETRRLARAQAQLLEARDCLLRHSLIHERYPDDAAFLRCRAETGRDPWGGELRLVRGVSPANLPLTEAFSPIEDPVRSQALTQAHPSRAILLPEGDNRTAVAFALVSLGRNGVADHGSYASLDTNAIAVLAADMDFSSTTKDDLVLPVQSYEVMGFLRNVVGPQ